MECFGRPFASTEGILRKGAENKPLLGGDEGVGRPSPYLIRKIEKTSRKREDLYSSMYLKVVFATSRSVESVEVEEGVVQILAWDFESCLM